MKTSITAAFIAASIALATSASASTFDRSNTASVLSDRSLNTASVEQNAAAPHAGRFIVATSDSATGGPSGGPAQNGG